MVAVVVALVLVKRVATLHQNLLKKVNQA